METKNVHCAGGIVCYLDQILVIRQNNNSWSLPKGHVEPGESYEDAARREIAEESGICALTYIAPLPTYDRYKLSLTGGDDFSERKSMHMFLFHASDPTLARQESQSEPHWMPLYSVSAHLTHPKDKAFYDAQLGLLYQQLRIPVICHISCPDTATAEALAHMLISQKLAACVQSSPINSTYQWEGGMTHSPEILLLIKTWQHHIPQIKTLLQTQHPYQVPECLVTPITDGSTRYLDWMRDAAK